jgi:hypothetical protein
MARRLGLDACPALVATRDGPALDQWLPTGQAFDHCIVRVRVDGVSHWIDPTQEAQVSPLGQIAECRYGWALPLAPGVDALEAMGEEPFIHSLDSVEHVVLGKSPSAPVKYEWRVTMRGWRAEQMRARIGREGEVGLFKLYAEDIQRSFPRAAPVTSPASASTSRRARTPTRSRSASPASPTSAASRSTCGRTWPPTSPRAASPSPTTRCGSTAWPSPSRASSPCATRTSPST